MQIFALLCDQHVGYLLPEPYADANAWLPFKVEVCYVDKIPKYLITRVLDGFTSGTFRKGSSQIVSWNGAPIARAVEIAGAQQAFGGNPAARQALGLLSLTARPLRVMPPPDEDTVDSWISHPARSAARNPVSNG